jgi:hypothetical protein
VPRCNCIPPTTLSPSSSVRNILTRLAETPEESLTVLRNGGWEHWIRDLLLVEMQNASTWGFTEGSDNHLQRADLIFRCRANRDVAAAVELKTNFVTQGQREITSRIGNAIDQLDGFLAIPVPGFIVYGLVHLRGVVESSLTNAQMHSSPSYKHFDIVRNIWPDNIVGGLPGPHHAGAVTVGADSEVAELRVWVAALAMDTGNLNSRILTFFDEDDQPMQSIWDKRDLLPDQRPKQERRWEWRQRDS